MRFVDEQAELRANLSAAAHLIHGSSEGRFTVTYCPGSLSRREIEGVHFHYGNLAEVMEKVAATIRERVKLQGQIRVLTAQGALSGWIVGLLPIVLGLLLYQMNPDYIGLLFSTEFGRVLLGIGATMQLCGVLLIKKIITIDV